MPMASIVLTGEVSSVIVICLAFKLSTVKTIDLVDTYPHPALSTISMDANLWQGFIAHVNLLGSANVQLETPQLTGSKT